MSEKALLLLGADSDIGVTFLKHWNGPVIAHVCRKPEAIDSVVSGAKITKVYGDFSSADGIEAFITSVRDMKAEIGKILFLPSMPAVPPPQALLPFLPVPPRAAALPLLPAFPGI